MRLLFLMLPTMIAAWCQSTDWQAGVARVSATGKSPGSGFVVAVRSGRAYIVTCAHVVEGDPKPSVTFRAAPEQRYSAQVRHLQGGRADGLALLIVDKPPAGVRALEAATSAAQAGASVVIAGYPVSVGAFSVLPATVVSVQGTEVYLAPVTGEGFSGGPVMLDGRVAGVVFGRGEFGRAVPAALVDIYLHGLDVWWGNEAPVVAAGTVRENAKDGLKYVHIPPGKFIMGCSAGDKECFSDEKPAREVTISQGFWIGQTEVTQAAYERVTGKNPSQSKGTVRPVENVSFGDAGEYCGLVGLRLPGDAEWEYAARAGNPKARYGEPGNIAWYSANSDGETHPVAGKQPNAWKLYDMLGNVLEWTSDLHPITPKGILRGGSWAGLPRVIRVSYRSGVGLTNLFDSIGFRCAGDLR